MSRRVIEYLDWLDRLAYAEENDSRPERLDRLPLPYREKTHRRRPATIEGEGRGHRDAAERHGRGGEMD